jgi:RHS repeat-associated protein
MNDKFASAVSGTARWRRAVALGVAVLLVPALTGMALPPGGMNPAPARLLRVPAAKPVPVHAVPSHKVHVRAVPAWHRPKVSWPAPGAATAALPGARRVTHAPPSSTWSALTRSAGLDTKALAMPSPGSSRAGTLPVWVGPAATASRRHRAGAGAKRGGGKSRAGAGAKRGGGKSRAGAGAKRGGGGSRAGVAAAAAPARVRVVMASRRAAAAAGVSGVIFTVSSAGGAARAAPVHVSLDYRSFAYADDGGYADRLRLVELPACVLTTPRVPSCRRPTPLASGDDVRESRVGANVTVPAAGGGPGGSGASAAGASGQVVLAATTTPSGSAGDYTATPLSEAGTWTAGGASGAFTYSYPVTVPPVPGGLEPQVSLDYNSQDVDGLTSSTNDQASWIGDGWDYQPGYVERDYQSCEQNPAGSTKTGDLCWSSNDVTTLSLGGTTTTLVDDPSTGWHAEADNGAKISYLTGSGGNGTHDDDYWVVTEPDGTSYYFGLNELPGYASADTQTDSAWTVPVYAPSSGQPCYNATFSQSHCMQAWRWNLDYVTDSHGDAEAFFYNTETNYYSADNGTTATASYTQGGALSKIEYGLRAGSVYGVTPAAEVNFTAGTGRTDVPTSTANGGDLACSSGAACLIISPTFWSKYQLTTIATETLKGSALEPVDSWALYQRYPNPNDATTTPSLWLESITRTGDDGSTDVVLPPVTFAPEPLANRVETAADLNDGYSIITRMRMYQITSETGAVTTVTYDSPPSSCTSGNFPAEDDNTSVCYPDYWTPPGASTPVEDWFNKYVVTQVSQQNTAGGIVPEVTNYCYGSSPGCLNSGAWHYDDDTLTRSNQRTWNEWRGFAKVTTKTGTSPDPVTETVDTYFQGMNGDYQSGGGTSSASLTSSLGNETVTDSDQFAGLDFEHIVYDGAGGSVVTDTVTVPWSGSATATQSQPSPLPSLQAFLTGTAETKTFTALASGGYREADVTSTHDSYGRVTTEADVPDTSDAAEDTCTQTSYATNTSSNLIGLPAEVIVTAVPPASCPVSGTPTQAELVSDTRYFYDGSTTLGAAPSAGNVTMTQKATSYSGSSPVFTTESKDGYDAYGRVNSATDADGDTTTTSYTPATGAEPTSQTVTDPMGLVTTTTYDPGRDLPLTVTNPAGWTTTETYDALGRLTAVWTPGHATSGPADETFSYDVSNTAPSVVTTNTITDTGGDLPSDTLYDSLGQQIETQSQTADGTGMNVSDTFYDSDGWPVVDSNPYYVEYNPSTKVQLGSLVAAPDDQVPSQTGYVYDGDGRVLKEITYSYANELWETDSSYGGDYTTVTPPTSPPGGTTPPGGTATTTYTNGDGLTSYIYSYHAATPPASPPAPGSGSQSGSAGWDQTAYTYTPAQQLASTTDAAENQWTYLYNLAGDQTSATDPDSGTATSQYDPDGNALSVTDGRGKTISYTYDADGRKTAEYDTTGGAAESGSDELASWAYDTLAKGEPTSSTSYAGGTSGSAYTEGVLGYNSYGLPTGTETVIPSSAGALAGTYKQADYYSTYGNLETSYYDAYSAGGLPAETVYTGYNSAGEPVSLTSSLSWDYVSQLSYTELGQPQEYAFGTTTQPAWLLNSYDLATNRLSSAETQVGVVGQPSAGPVTVDDTSYSYDNSGDILSEADTPASGPAQVQCFGYDYLGRLAQAWSQGSAGCSAGPSQSAESAAAAPYWDTYTYNDENDLTSQTSTPASGAATTTTNSYPPAGSAQPHALTSQQVSGPSGTTATSYGYNAAGDTTSITSPTATQSLSWNDAGQLSSIARTGTGGGTTSYVYDASGNLLLQSDPASETLYLPDEQLVDSGGTITGTRYYAIGGVTAAARTSSDVSGTYSSQISYLTGNQQGTGTLAINYQTLAVTRRYYDPYGNPIGTAPTSWPGTRGFVGGTADPVTGLVNLGAREYNPATSSFISPDPLVNTADPQDLNAYAYASDSPATNSDPSGAMFCNGGGYCGGGVGSSNGHPTVSPGPGGNVSDDSGSGGGRSDPAPVEQVGGLDLPVNYPHVTQIVAAYKAFLPTYEAGRPGSTSDPDFGFASLETFCNQDSATEALCGTQLSSQLRNYFEGIQAVANALPLPFGAAPDEDEPGTTEIEAKMGEVADTDAADIELQIESDDCGGMSFSAGTRVLLATGKTAPIIGLKPGDKVLATDTRTGKTHAERITAVLVHHDSDLYDLALRTRDGAVVIDTTASHLFWEPAAHRWVTAIALRRGDHLRGADGSSATVTGGYTPRASVGWMWDLTVPADHDFYAGTAAASVLVHNCPTTASTETPGEDERDPARGPVPKWKQVVSIGMTALHTFLGGPHPLAADTPEFPGTFDRNSPLVIQQDTDQGSGGEPPPVPALPDGYYTYNTTTDTWTYRAP